MRNLESLVAHSADFPLENVVLPVLPDITVTSVCFNDRTAMLPIEAASLTRMRSSPFDAFYYGGVGTPTTEALSQAVARLEGGGGAVLTPSGQSAISLLILDRLGHGDHVLISEGLTFTSQWLFEDLSRKMNFDVTRFGTSDLHRFDTLIRPTTRFIFAEVPTSVVFDIFDIEPIVRISRSRGIPVVLDTTWSASHYLPAFELGADATVLSLAKMHAGVQGVSMGAVVVRDPEQLGSIRNQAALLGLNVAPASCARAATALVTLSARLAFQANSSAIVIDALQRNQAIRTLYHPSIANSENHTLWLRYFTGAAPLVSIRLCRDDLGSVDDAIDRMRLIKRGYGWGGSISLCQPMQLPHSMGEAWLLRLYMGLEHPADLVHDLTQAFG